ncbi:MAG: radical SAM protein [Deltaproteobacteria bacterium]|nr:radical SAM protein [Deltaproteobacteria bacterium]
MPMRLRKEEPNESEWASLVRVFREPVPRRTRALLRRTWRLLPESLRGPRQFQGRQYVGCGATIGTQPRCDFACRGCYLGDGANQTPAQPLAESKRQLRRIRAWLGEGGNVQLTDGELTLLPEDELVELIRYAREIGLVPMLMTHGDAFRRRPGLLESLLERGGLGEASIHIDSTQRGRLGAAYKNARCEVELHPLRDEFAEMIRAARRATGRTLDVASTVTVTRENLGEVADVVLWHRRNADAFKMVSFQPVARVGRTEGGIVEAVGVRELWEAIAAGLGGDPSEAKRLLAHQGWLGHPACSLFLQGIVVEADGAEPVFQPLFRPDDPRDQPIVEEWFRRFGGLTLRLDGRARAVARVVGLVARHPTFFLGRIVPYLARWPRRLSPGGALDFFRRWRRGSIRLRYLNVVSHHFMSAEELETESGRERLGTCVFRVPIADRMVPMCEVNARGIRDELYRAADRRSPAEQNMREV